MNVQKVIAALREERACLDEVLISLERLLLTRAPRRGRPPSLMKAGNAKRPNQGDGAQGERERAKRAEKAINSAAA